MEQHKIDLAKYRLEKSKEHLKSAEDLLKNGHLRDSISRAYYAIFTTARAILGLRELDSKKHSGVIALFNQHFVKTGILSVTASKIIQEAKSYREKADYEDFFIINQEEAKKQFENAISFIEEVERKVDELI
ncbi:MAG: HEPN domain-containing protein [Nitrospirota bacterium]